MKPIKINNTLQIIEVDDKQYGLQRRAGKKWETTSFCATRKALLRDMVTALENNAKADAVKEVHVCLKASNIPWQIDKLKPKPGDTETGRKANVDDGKF